MDLVSVEWLIIADAAQVVGNKLYLMGGGWDVLNVTSAFPLQQRLAIAVSIRVPWNETNRRHHIEVAVETEDGRTLGKFDGQLEMGRPPGIPPGQAQRGQLALDMGLTLDAPGTYVVIARLNGEESARAHFNVVHTPMPAARGPE